MPIASPAHRGFTMIETLITVTVIGVTAAISARELSRYLEQRRAIVAARQVQWEIAIARSFAVRLGRPVTTIVDEPLRLITTRDTSGAVLRTRSFDLKSDMPLHSLILDIPGDSLRFSERGLCLNCPASGSATFTVRASNRTRYVRIGLLGRGEITTK